MVCQTCASLFGLWIPIWRRALYATAQSAGDHVWASIRTPPNSSIHSHSSVFTTIVKSWNGWHNVQPSAFSVYQVAFSQRSANGRQGVRPLDHLHASEMMLTVESQHRFAHHQSRPAVANREYGLTLGTGAPRRARVHEVGQLNF